MRRDFAKFLKSNGSFWSYNIVPSLVEQLDKALKENADIKEIIIDLELQGVTYRDDKLAFLADIILKDVISPTKKLREARIKSEMTQRAIADMYNIPLRTWEDWEAGRRNPPSYAIDRPIRALECLKPGQTWINAVVDDSGKADIFTTECKTRAEAEEEAKKQWGYLTNYEKKGRRIIAGMLLKEIDEWGDALYTDIFEEYVEYKE